MEKNTNTAVVDYKKYKIDAIKVNTIATIIN